MSIRLMIMTACACIFSHAAVFAAEGVAVEVGGSVFGKYIWRGQNLSDDPVFQTSISTSYRGLTALVWGNMDLTNINGNSGDVSELDYSLCYDGQFPGIKGVGYCVGIAYYDFPGTSTNDTTEVSWGFNLDVPLKPAVMIYHDVDEADGTYFSVGIGHSMAKFCNLASDVPVGLEIGASLGWGNRGYDKYYWGTNQGKLNDLTLAVSFPFELGGWTIAPSMNYVTLLSDDIRATDTYRTDSDYFFVGISLSKRF